MKNIKIIFLWLLMVVACMQPGYSQDASANFTKVEISFTTTPENPAICNLNKGVKVKVNEPFIRVYWLAPSGARPLIGQDVTLNEFGKWQVKVEKLINGTTCTHTQELMVRDISRPDLIERYFTSNNFFPVTINRDLPGNGGANVSCEAGLEAVNFKDGGTKIRLNSVNFEGFEDFRPFQGMSYVKTITNNNCLCDDTGESKVAEFESKLGSGDLSVWGHQFFTNNTVTEGKLFLKASMSWNASSPSGAHKTRLGSILPILVETGDTPEQGRKLFTNLFMNQPIGGYNVADYCNDPEGCYLTENFLTPSGVAIKLPDGASEFVFASSDKPDGVFEGAIIGMTNSDGKQMGYHYKNGAFAGYYNDLLATVMDEIEVAPAPEANDELYAFVTRDCMGCKFVRIAVDNIVNTQDEHGGINLPLKSIVTSRFIPSCKERRFRDNLRTDFYVSYLAPTANLIQVPFNDVQNYKYVAGGYETANVEEVVGGMLWGFDLKIQEGTTCIYKDYTYDVNTKSYKTKTGEEYSAEAAGDKGLQDFGYLIQLNNGNLGLFFLTNGGNRPKHVNGEGENYHESFTTLTEVMGFVPFSDNYPLPNGGGGGEKDASNCSFCASSEFSKEIISGKFLGTWIFEEKIAQLATKYPAYFVDAEENTPTNCGFAFTQFENWEDPQDVVSISPIGNFLITVPGNLWPWNVYLTANPSVKAKFNSDKIGFYKEMINQIAATKQAQMEWWNGVAQKTVQEIVCHLRKEPQAVTTSIPWPAKKRTALDIVNTGSIYQDKEDAIIHLLASSSATDVLPYVEEKTVSYFFSKFDDAGGDDNLTRIMTLISAKIKEQTTNKVVNLQIYHDNTFFIPKLEADLWAWENLTFEIVGNSVEINGIPYDYDIILPIEIAGTFTVGGTTYTKGLQVNMPAIQAALLAHDNGKEVVERVGWIVIDLGTLALGVGGAKILLTAGNYLRKAAIVGDLVGSTAGLAVQVLDNDDISPELRSQIQIVAFALSLPQIGISIVDAITTSRNLRKNHANDYDAVQEGLSLRQEAARRDLANHPAAWNFVRTNPIGAEAWEFITLAINNKSGTLFARDLKTLEKVAEMMADGSVFRSKFPGNWQDELKDIIDKNRDLRCGACGNLGITRIPPMDEMLDNVNYI